MFESIQKGLGDAFRYMRGQTRFTEANMQEGMKAVRRSLLEADVSVQVADSFIKRVEQQAAGREVLKSLRPSEQIVQVVYEELVQLMGPVDPTIRLVPNRPTVLMMCGLQGSGKTTTCGKLAKMLQRDGQRPLLVAADLQRPAAIEQLKVLGQQLNVPVHAEENSTPIKVCQNAIQVAKSINANIIILDTAGRLAIDKELMRELEQIDQRVSPDYCYLVCDAMTGQDAVRSAKAFNDALELDGVILSKLDGDARGGAALSIKEVTGVPIKFAGMGEQLDALEPFRPEGMAQRILGMGDVLALVNKAQQTLSEDEVRKQQEKMQQGKFDLNDFRDQMKMIRSMGPMKSLLENLPGGLASMIPEGEDPEEAVGQLTAIINSMTSAERSKPELIDHSRRLRIAKGAGVEPHEVNKLVKQFDAMRETMQKMSNLSMMGRMKQMMDMVRGGGGGLSMFDGLMKRKERSERNPLTDKQRADQRKAERKRKKDNRKRKK